MKRHIQLFEEFVEVMEKSSTSTYMDTDSRKHHINVNLGMYDDFEESVYKALKFWKSIKNRSKGKNIQYVDVASDKEFAIIHITQDYLNSINAEHFDNGEEYNTWLNVAKRALKSGVVETGVYGDEGITAPLNFLQYGVYVYDSPGIEAPPKEKRYFADDKEAVKFAKKVERTLPPKWHVNVYQKEPNKSWV